MTSEASEDRHELRCWRENVTLSSVTWASPISLVMKSSARWGLLMVKLSLMLCARNVKKTILQNYCHVYEIYDSCGLRLCCNFPCEIYGASRVTKNYL